MRCDCRWRVSRRKANGRLTQLANNWRQTLAKNVIVFGMTAQLKKLQVLRPDFSG